MWLAGEGGDEARDRRGADMKYLVARVSQSKLETRGSGLNDKIWK